MFTIFSEEYNFEKRTIILKINEVVGEIRRNGLLDLKEKFYSS